MNYKEAIDTIQRVYNLPTIRQRSNRKDELAEACMVFSRQFLIYKKAARDENQLDEMSAVMSVELYTDVINNQRNIRNLEAYMNVGYRGYIDKWRKEFCATGDQKPVSNPDKYYNVGFARRYTAADTDVVLDKIYVSEVVDNLFNEVHKFVRYYPKWSSSSASTNAHLSLVLSLRYGHFVNFRLTGNDLAITRLLYNKYRLFAAKTVASCKQSTISDQAYLSAITGEIFRMNGILKEDD